MGLFKQMKDMKETVAAAPDMIANAQALGASAQQMAAAQQAQADQAMAAQQAAATAAATGPDFEPIAGVSLDLYADISRDLATVNYDQTRAPGLALSRGVTGDRWQEALDGWNGRIQANPAVAQRFNALYTGRA
jgi:hypothetical protein